MQGLVEKSRLFIAALAMAFLGVSVVVAQEEAELTPPSVSVEIVGFEGLTEGAIGSGTVTFTLNQGDFSNAKFLDDADFASLVSVSGAAKGDIATDVDPSGLVATLTIDLTPDKAGEDAVTVSVASGDAMGLIDDVGDELADADVESIVLSSASLTRSVAAAEVGGGEEPGEEIDISEAVVEVVGSYTYSGLAIVPAVVVTLDGETLELGVDYTVEGVDNVNAGEATVNVVGTGDYAGTASATFAIARKVLEVADFDFNIPNNHAYTGEERGIGDVTFLSPIEDATAVITVSYYAVKGGDSEDGEGGEDGEDGEDVEGGEGDVEVTGNAKSEDDEAVTPIEIGAYIVKVTVEGGSNVEDAVLELGTYMIRDSADVNVSVAESVRDVPAGKVSETAVISPVKVIAAEFVAGPNPTSKAIGKVSFFWQGQALKSGKLVVFDASGNMVKKVAVSDKSSATARREVGAWDLRSAKGAPVADGTYIVKGTLVGKDGKAFKVSSVISVK